MRVGDLATLLGAEHAAFASLAPKLRAAVNHEMAEPDRALADGDEVAFLPPVAGGSGAAPRCTISERALDVGEVVARVVGPEAGGIVTDDVIRSLVVSHFLLGTAECMIINHTDCGLMRQREDELRKLVVERAGAESEAPARFFAFDDLDENVRRQMQKLRVHPWVPRELPVRGFVYDVKTGRLREVAA